MVVFWVCVDTPYVELAARGFVRPGVLLEMQSGRRLLVGDINELGGVCDDCTDVAVDGVVSRYAVIYTHQETNQETNSEV